MSMTDDVTHISGDWLNAEPLQSLLSVLNEAGRARLVGGCVRNALLGEAVGDIDIATTLLPAEVMTRAEEAGFKPVPTGIDHGTITVVVDSHPFEVTTLREDIATDGRHAEVRFGSDWTRDAERRDFTMNALYAEPDGAIIDPLGGLSDALARRVVFIGDAEQRIREDTLRILRFFRFFAWYGAFRPDAEGLKACARMKDGLGRLSAERVWQELSKLLAAPDPTRALLWARQTGVLSAVLPETERWGIDAAGPLVAIEQEKGIAPDALQRLMAIIAPDKAVTDALATRLKVSNVVRTRLKTWAEALLPDAGLKEDAFRRFAASQDRQGLGDRLLVSAAQSEKESRKRLRQLKWLGRFEMPEFPVTGADVLEAGVKPGPRVANLLNALREEWIASDFAMDRETLIARLKATVDKKV